MIIGSKHGKFRNSILIKTVVKPYKKREGKRVRRIIMPLVKPVTIIVGPPNPFLSNTDTNMNGGG